MREVFHSSKLAAPKFKYSPCIKTGPFYHFSGMVALDPGTGSMVTGGVYSESARILENLKIFAGELGLGLGHLATAKIYTTKMGEFPEINRAWEEVFAGDLIPPARTSIGVSALPVNALVEMEFSFYKP
jgi:2-iminobutanoate/2-iminopropanoate deaminase